MCYIMVANGQYATVLRLVDYCTAPSFSARVNVDGKVVMLGLQPAVLPVPALLEEGVRLQVSSLSEPTQLSSAAFPSHTSVCLQKVGNVSLDPALALALGVDVPINMCLYNATVFPPVHQEVYL